MAMIHRVTALDLTVDDWRWPFATERRDEIDAHFTKLCAANPALWNGIVLLARKPCVDGEIFSACYFKTDFASFIAWRDWGSPDTTVINGFGMGALRGSDGGFVLGEMAPHTSNAGRIYFPSGTPDLNDVVDGRLDIAGSVVREVAEETGLTPSDYAAGRDWHCVIAGSAVALIRILDMPCSADEIRRRVEANLMAQAAPELCAIHIVRNIGDMTPAMPSFVAAFLTAQSRDAA